MAGENELIFWVSGGPLTSVEIGVQGIREIIQNVKTILATRKGSVFLDRNFGVSQDMVDDPMPVARQKFIGEVTAEVERREPRVKVVKVETVNPGLNEANNGTFVPRVLVRIRDGVLL